MAFGKSPSTCAHQVVLSLCVASCLAFGASPRPTQGLRDPEAVQLAQRMALALTLTLHVPGMRITSAPPTGVQLETAASTRGSWPRKTLLSPNN